MTAGEAFSKVRQMLSDVDSGNPRWSNDQQRPYLNAGRRLLWGRRPVAFSHVQIVTAMPADLSDDDDDLDFDPLYFDPICAYIAAQCIGEDAEHAANLQMSKNFLAQFADALA